MNYTSDVSVIASYLLDIPSRGLYQALCVGSPASGQRLVGINLGLGEQS